MFVYPDISPIAFSLGPVEVHWYGLMYLVGFIGCWLVGRWRTRLAHVHWQPREVGDLLFYVVLGVVLGGRIGYMLFYATPLLIHHPLSLFRIWDGGMSFHGGLIGVLIAIGIYAWRTRRHYFVVTDFVAPLVPIGLFFGRIGNFINGELWGKPAHLPWAMRLPCTQPRFHMFCNGSVYHFADPTHPGYSVALQPSQLYEMLLEGALLFTICLWFSLKPRPRMTLSALFILGYGVFRFGVEFVRLPDPQLGYIAFGWLTMGQALSLPMIGGGLVLLYFAYRRRLYEQPPGKRAENDPERERKESK
jgi:phosphatidylglycerol:prolipoprotein diacylglycerol transferase